MRELFAACDAGDLDKVRELIEANPAILHSRDVEGLNVAHRACSRAHHHILEVM